MPATQLATSTIASPLDAAETEQEAAHSAVARLTAAITELTRSGPGFDQILLARLESEREAAQKVLRAADLEAAETVAAATGPLSPKVLEKIRLRRRRVEDWHAAVLGRMGESQWLREHLGRVKNEIATLEASWEFREDQREMRNEYLFPRDAQTRDPAAPARSGVKTPQSVQRLAQLERDLEITVAELKIASAAQIVASERWQLEKAILDGWERAACSLGPSARAVLNALPQPGAAPMAASTNRGDFRDGIVGRSLPAIR